MTEPDPLRNVLLVEDDDHIRLIVKVSLTRLTKWTIAEARNGKEGLEMALHSPPDLFLLDIMMPVMDGLTLFRHIRAEESLRHIPVIFMTAKVQFEEIESYIALGARGVITKPVDPMTLPEKITAILSR
jgi:two-component system OmpR family response regulator